MKKFMPEVTKAVIIGILMWVGQSLLGVIETVKDTEARTLRQEETIKQVLIQIRDLRYDQNALIRKLIK